MVVHTRRHHRKKSSRRVDGETMHGARQGQVLAPHLPISPNRATGTVLTQQGVTDRFNEIPSLLDLPDAVGLSEQLSRAGAASDRSR